MMPDRWHPDDRLVATDAETTERLAEWAVLRGRFGSGVSPVIARPENEKGPHRCEP
jgi:hypothetical protein